MYSIDEMVDICAKGDVVTPENAEYLRRNLEEFMSYDMPAIVKKVQKLETQVTALLVLLDGFRNIDPYMEFSQAWQDADKAGLLGFLTSCKQPE
jgi:tetrahydromethanopterin S-methyltransferase subunit B